MIIPILICIKYAGKVKSEVASSIVKCLVLMIITILSNGVFVLSDNQLFSYVMEGLYLFCRFGWNFTASKCVFSSCIYVKSRKLYKFSDVSY